MADPNSMSVAEAASKFLCGEQADVVREAVSAGQSLQPPMPAPNGLHAASRQRPCQSVLTEIQDTVADGGANRAKRENGQRRGRVDSRGGRRAGHGVSLGRAGRRPAGARAPLGPHC